jgi:hypothetical protein
MEMQWQLGRRLMGGTVVAVESAEIGGELEDRLTLSVGCRIWERSEGSKRWSLLGGPQALRGVVLETERRTWSGTSRMAV